MTSYNLFLANFHFVRPLWLLAIIVLFIVLWLLKRHRFHQSPWQKLLPAHLSGVLVEGANTATLSTKKPWHQRLFLIKPFFIGLLSIIALAGPAWQKLPQPVYQTERGSVLIMDMSFSMYATDTKPNRLTRARFKAIDLLNKINHGDVGLIAYAGDAFVISPLTQDIKNIELLLPSLTPDIMPELGANPFAALTLAHEMLTNAGHLTGDIYWFTDDVDNEELDDIYDWSSKSGHRLNILGIGSANGAPIKLPSGELLKDNNGAIVVPRLPVQKLQALASRGHGNYQTITNDDSDINNLILELDVLEQNKSKQQESQQTGDQWQEQGAWLLILVLPLALGYFRRGGAILLLPFTCLPLLVFLTTTIVSTTSYAKEASGEIESKATSESSFLQKTWQNLWQTQDQQAQQQYNQENYQSAAQRFEDSQWQGSAHYKAGNYQQALEAFQQGELANSANSLYNQGNSLAQMQKYDQAIDAYEKALEKKPDLQDAKDNIEKIKQQQKQEQEQQKSDQSNNEKSDDEKSEDKGEQQKSDSDSQQSQDEKDQNQDQDQQASNNADEESQPNDKQQEQSPGESNKEESKNEAEQKQEQQANQDEESTEQGKEKTAEQIAAEQQAKEKSQKHQQLLNKVTDDPYLLLRNKMQLEYQKRRQDGASQGVQKKW